jgi:hypothetical protein
MNDISTGKYNVVATVGPSYTTQRTEARQSMGEFLQYFPAAAPVIGDIYAEVQDWPGATRLAKRLRHMVPKEITDVEDAEQAANEGKSSAPPQQVQQPPPDPMMLAKLEEEKLKVQELTIKVQQEQAKLEGILIENKIKSETSRENIKQLVDEIINENAGGGVR